jgi:hypothetical protein
MPLYMNPAHIGGIRPIEGGLLFQGEMNGSGDGPNAGRKDVPGFIMYCLCFFS